jgi:allantoicase
MTIFLSSRERGQDWAIIQLTCPGMEAGEIVSESVEKAA